MNSKRLLAIVVSMSAVALPATSYAQTINVTRSIFPDQPYTLIYPEAMVATGGAGEPLTINHPNAPLQCDLSVVPVEDADWSAEAAVAALDASAITEAWVETFPGFTLGETGTKNYQDATALYYEGTSESSSMGVPITLVHSETVAQSRGYSLDCIYATSVAEQVRPAVEFIIANFSTRSDADCCVGATPETEQAPPQ
ncbi:hypothetical protein [Devosia sp. Leaf64]|uniref:hypothetical protein n=1 Tax=Devosia sp. Leaf64 TaxID=1736229 RepID=UPI000715948F|nr:hypothetical protein [Devosia sp. Leaf64]KQN74225.1 hypothetical protein ASE94_04280 [Devosia sp. Leaf64]